MIDKVGRAAVGMDHHMIGGASLRGKDKATMAYDGFDRQVRWTFPSPTAAGQVNASDYEQYGYDAVGNRTSFRKRDGSTLGYATTTSTG